MKRKVDTIMAKRSSLIITIILMVAILCACSESNVENIKQNDIENRQPQNEKVKEEPLIEPLSEEQEKQQKKEKLAELTVQLESAEFEFNKLFKSDRGVGRIIGNEIVYDNKKEKSESQIRDDNIKMQGYHRLIQNTIQQIYSLLDLEYDEKYILDFKDTWDEQINGNRPLNPVELAIYYPKIIVPWEIGDYHFVQAMIGSQGRGPVENSDEPCNTILKRDMTINPLDTVELIYTQGEKSVSLHIINVKDIFTLSEYIDELKVDLIHEDLKYTDYMTEPWKPDYKGYKLYKYAEYINDNCYDGFGLFNTEKTYYIAVTAGTNRINSSLKRLVIIPDNENTYDNLVRLMDDFNLSEKADNLITELGLK